MRHSSAKRMDRHLRVFQQTCSCVKRSRDWRCPTNSWGPVTFLIEVRFASIRHLLMVHKLGAVSRTGVSSSRRLTVDRWRLQSDIRSMNRATLTVVYHFLRDPAQRLKLSVARCRRYARDTAGWLRRNWHATLC